MLRNKEIQLFLISTIIVLSAGIIAATFISAMAAIIVAITGSILFISYLLLLIWRYRRMTQLSQYLRQIMAGDTSLDLRDNREGELSILKNDIYKMTRMLSEQQEVLQEDKGKLTDAISDISHQLKTPLTSMTVMADLLSDPHLADKKRLEFTHNIRKQLERMDWLVSSLLKLSKIDAGTITFARDRVYVAELITDVIAPMEIPMELKEIALHVEGDRDVTFIGDKNWTKEACINILKNAIEHTSTGGMITIHFQENALYTELTIRDDGKGIAKRDLPYIFQRFYKGDQAADGSVGIGLAMAYTIITNQHGDIEVTSQIDQGTAFLIKFYKQIV
ncbi:sensor histidine kinase [Gracilibacillus alcaliphilus]|uniref:sensor histidine kinase n=1 Tax=Gracilibacillus alcaliphilus TaxID=1401441 RepID=UPI00195B7205|nr:HAMP domain-containing sensor histidine kinase [Gracilibacillus alcaliphilus]MBM7676487.1 signal transduction histidine kinase [Gracilibacillus alcaliphilus]